MYTKPQQFGKLIIIVNVWFSLCNSLLLGSSEGKQKMNNTLCYKSKYNMKMQIEIKEVFEEWQTFFKGILACVHECELECVHLKPVLK